MKRPGSQIRVLWLIKGLGIGGAEQLLVQTAQLADRSRVAFDAAYLLQHKEQLRDRLEAAGVTTYCLEARHETDMRWARRLQLLIAQERYDIVHAHSPYAASVARIALRLMPRSRRPALFYTEHNNWNSYSRPTRLANRLTARWDDARFAVSGDAHSSMSASLRATTEVITQGISLQDDQTPRNSRSGMRQALGISNDEVLALTVANLRAEKAYPDLLQAAHMAIAAMPNQPRLRFAAVGQGPQQSLVADHHRGLDLGEDFLLLGQRSDVADLLRSADIFVLSSHYEGLPIALLEAMAAGLPAVVTAVGGIPDVVRDGIEGRLVPARRPDLLAAAVVELATDERARGQLADGARRRAGDFDLGRSVELLLDRYASWGGPARSRATSEELDVAQAK
jgi:glycosyltransferase involved in cell wall biosynthesis